MSYPMGNVHPRFWAWYMGSSNFTGAVGDFLAAIQGSNLGGGNHAAALMDQQVVNWCKEMMGFPSSASGTLVSGGSMANIIGLTVARNAQEVVVERRSNNDIRFERNGRVRSRTLWPRLVLCAEKEHVASGSLEARNELTGAQPPILSEPLAR